MALQVEVRDIEHRDWARVVESFDDHNFETCLTYTLAHSKKLGSEARLVEVADGQKSIGAAVIRLKSVPFTGRAVAYVSSGPLFRPRGMTRPADENMKTVVNALKDWVVGRSGHLLLMRLPIWIDDRSEACTTFFGGLGFAPTNLVRSYKTALVDLSSEETKLRANLHSKWRNMLTQSQKNGLTVVEGTATDGWQRFQKLYDSMKELKEFDGGLGPQFFAPLDAKDAGLVFLFAQKDGADIGSIIVSALGDTALYVFGATDAMGRELRAGYLLQWEALKFFKSKGFRWYDLGGVDETTNPGGYQFKARMGSLIAAAPGPYKLVPKGIRGALINKALEFRKKRQGASQ